MKGLILIAAVTVALSGPAALAQDAAAAASSPPADQAQAAAQVDCHHDGEVLLTANGPVVCHLKHPTGARNFSREWFREQQLRSSTMNH
ncbi:MAG: hypothetical protein ACREHE_10230 [Rhizomicrobium sp.]